MASDSTTPRPKPAAKPTPAEKKPVRDLDVQKDDANKVKGGKIRLGDPCDGGE